MLEYVYGVLLGCAAIAALMLAYALTSHAVRSIRERRERNTKWMPATRQVGTQTWIVVQLIHHNWAGERILAEQLVATVKITEPFHDEKVRRKERVAELRAAWLNHGSPETPRI